MLDRKLTSAITRILRHIVLVAKREYRSKIDIIIAFLAIKLLILRAL